MDKKNQLIVITLGSYPYGGAATNRHLSYLRGLVELDVEIKLFILRQVNNQSPKSNQNKGIFNGIKFQYVVPLKRNTGGYSSKLLNKFVSVSKSLQLVKKELNEDKECKMLLLLTDPFEIIPFLKLGKRNNIEIYHERTELPFLEITGLFKILKLRLYLKVVKYFDGIFVITKVLEDYFTKFTEKEKIAHIPMTVEPDRFDCKKHIKSKSIYGRYIAYCGSMYTDKDGVPILIDAFDCFAKKYKDINLVLIGDITNKFLFHSISQKIHKVKSKDRIFLTGQVERNKMSELLCNAEVLALARPDNIQAKGGFPTKLGEYLATGNPVIVTAVGEITNYLTNKKNAYICAPGSIESFCSGLIEVYSNLSESKKIGIEGKKIVYSTFSYLVQAKNIKRFIFNA